MKIVPTEIKTLYAYLKVSLRPYGKIKPTGSAFTQTYLYNDIDIKLYTRCSSKEFLKDELIRIKRNAPVIMFAPLHMFVIGTFTYEVVEEKDLMIHYLSPISEKVLWISLKLKRFLKSLQKK
jgi:hypothetical protein